MVLRRGGVGRDGTWRNWAGTTVARPAHIVAPASTEEVVRTVRWAGERGLTVRAAGTGHSFSATAATDGVLVLPHRMAGIRAVDRAAGTVTVGAGTPLWRLNRELAAAGLSLTNMGDIAAQTVAGAVSTGTHGTGRDSGSLAAQVTGMELVLADGRVLRCSASEHPEVFRAARIGLGALGVVTQITFAVEPLFLLRAREEGMRLDRVLADFDQLRAENEHFEFYWFPHTDRCLTKRNNRSPGPVAPLPTARRWFDDELLSNGVFGAVCALGRAVPATVPLTARLTSRALGTREYVDLPYRVFTSPRRVRFVEMEYALPVEAAVPALRALRRAVERSSLRVGFPVEVRTTPGDDIPLSPATGRRSVHIAVHVYRGTPYQAYFTLAERIMTEHEGRPHWGKLHSRDARHLARAYPEFAAFRALRDRLDPQRRFTNAYTRRVLGA